MPVWTECLVKMDVVNQRRCKFILRIQAGVNIQDSQDPIWFPLIHIAHIWLLGYCLCTAVATPWTTVLTDWPNYVSEPAEDSVGGASLALVHEVWDGKGSGRAV